MQNKKIFAFDLDGTLLSSEGKILESTKQALKKAKESDHLIVMATGRGVSAIYAIYNQLPIFDYAICNNGTLLYNFNDKISKVFGIIADDIVQYFIDQYKKNRIYFCN